MHDHNGCNRRYLATTRPDRPAIGSERRSATSTSTRGSRPRSCGCHGNGRERLPPCSPSTSANAWNPSAPERAPQYPAEPVPEIAGYRTLLRRHHRVCCLARATGHRSFCRETNHDCESADDRGAADRDVGEPLECRRVPNQMVVETRAQDDRRAAVAVHHERRNPSGPDGSHPVRISGPRERSRAIASATYSGCVTSQSAPGT